MNRDKDLKLGYDSLSAGCTMNHLHFELLWVYDLYEEMTKRVKTLEGNSLKEGRLAIEDAKTDVYFNTYLSYKVKEESEINIVSLF